MNGRHLWGVLQIRPNHILMKNITSCSYNTSDKNHFVLDICPSFPKAQYVYLKLQVRQDGAIKPSGFSGNQRFFFSKLTLCKLNLNNPAVHENKCLLSQLCVPAVCLCSSAPWSPFPKPFLNCWNNKTQELFISLTQWLHFNGLSTSRKDLSGKASRWLR